MRRREKLIGVGVAAGAALLALASMRAPVVVTELNIATTGPYRQGESLWLRVSFSRPVRPVGAPAVGLSIGTQTRPAIHEASGTSSNQWFRYVVRSSDVDSDGVSIRANALRQNPGARFVDRAGIEVDLRLDRHVVVNRADQTVAGNLRHRTRVESVTILSRPRNGESYAAGEKIRVAVQFSTPVTVLPAPTLRLSVGGHNRDASWTGTEGRILFFTYAVTVADRDADGIAIHPAALRVPVKGGIRGAAGEDVDLMIENRAASGVPAHRVDGRPPVVEQVGFASLPASDSWEAGERLEVDVEFNKDIVVTPAGPGTPELPALRVQIGERTRLAKWDPVGSESPRLRFVYTFGEMDQDADGIGIAADALRDNGWVIADITGNRAYLDLGRQAIAPHADHKVVATEVLESVRVPVQIVRASSPVVDRTAPVPRTPPALPSNGAWVTSVRVVSDESKDAYGRGEAVWIRIAFNEPVVVSGSPTLDLYIGNRRKRAVCRQAGTSTAELWCRYEVEPTDHDVDGIEIPADGLRVDAGGGIRSAAGAAVNLAFRSSVVDAARLLVDGSLVKPVSVEQVVFASQPAVGDTYRAGEEIRVQVVFESPVAVPSEHPILTLKVGQNQRDASLRPSAAKAHSLMFSYTVASNDMDADGVGIAPDALHVPAGGSILDAAGVTVNLALGRHAVSHAPRHRVDGQRPVVSSVVIYSDAGRSGVHAPGARVRITVGLTEEIAVVPRPSSRHNDKLHLPRLGMLVGERVRWAELNVFGVGSSTVTFEYEFQPDDVDLDGITIAAVDPRDYAITDAVGNPADLTLGSHRVANDSAHVVDNIAANDIVLSDAQVVLTSSDQGVFDQPIVADHVLVNESITTKRPVYIVANHVSFSRNGSIDAPAITVIANRVSGGGRLDASGSDARGRAGARAGNGGTILVVAARIGRTLLDISGGDGAPGRRGRRGRAGLAGRCTSVFGLSTWFGGQRWRDATAGGNGSDGGRGGNGGLGGTVTLLTLPGHAQPVIDIAGGKRGAGGPGGLGGVGGRGCYPLLHAYTNPHKPNGQNGRRGLSGRQGNVGRLLASRKFRHQRVVERLNNADLTDEQAILAVARGLVAAADETSWEQLVPSTIDSSSGRRRR